MPALIPIAVPEVPKGDARLLIAATALVCIFQLADTRCLLTVKQGVHYLFKRYEPRAPLVHITLLGLPPSLLSLLIQPYFGAFGSLWRAFALFLTVLSTSVVLYRISPFHPLASYPGPLLHKISRLSFMAISAQGHQHVYIQKLHEHYGDIVRLGTSNSVVRSPQLSPDVIFRSERGQRPQRCSDRSYARHHWLSQERR